MALGFENIRCFLPATNPPSSPFFQEPQKPALLVSYLSPRKSSLLRLRSMDISGEPAIPFKCLSLQPSSPDLDQATTGKGDSATASIKSCLGALICRKQPPSPYGAVWPGVQGEGRPWQEVTSPGSRGRMKGRDQGRPEPQQQRSPPSMVFGRAEREPAVQIKTPP